VKNRFALKNSDSDLKVITFTINFEIKARLKEILKNSDYYTLKMKSQWINEAIVSLSKLPDYKQIVCNAEGNSENFVFDKIYMTFEQRCLFAEVRNEVVKSHPDIRGPQAAIIRAAILSRMMRKT